MHLALFFEARCALSNDDGKVYFIKNQFYFSFWIDKRKFISTFYTLTWFVHKYTSIIRGGISNHLAFFFPKAYWAVHVLSRDCFIILFNENEFWFFYTYYIMVFFSNTNGPTSGFTAIICLAFDSILRFFVTFFISLS